MKPKQRFPEGSLLSPISTSRQWIVAFFLTGKIAKTGLASQVLLNSGMALEKACELVKQVLAEDQTTSVPESEQHGES